MLLDIYNKIKENDTIIIHRHAKPDGDALGSQLGLKFAILETFPNKCVKAVGDMQERYNFVDNMDIVSDELYKDALVIVCDCGSEKLISDERYKNGKYMIKIDHHLPQGEYGDLVYLDNKKESCAGIIAELIMNTPLKITKEVATYLFLGLVTDSGRFRYQQTTSKTFDIASYLMKNNADAEYVYNKIYIDKLENVKLRAKFVSKFKVTSDNVAYLITKNTELEKYGLSAFDASRGMINIMAGIENINIWANFTEISTGEVYCEIRSSCKNINVVATEFGGGGHLFASGCTLPNLKYVKKVLNRLNEVARGTND